MDPEDFVSPEVGITAAVVAAVASPQLRKVVRRGAVYSLAGILMAGDAITSFARGVNQGVSQQARNVAGAAAAVTHDGQQQPAHQGEAHPAGEPS